MSQELQKADFYEDLNVVMQHWLRGETNFAEIARQTDMPRAKVVKLYEYWKQASVNNPDVKDMAKEQLMAMIQSYDDIIKEFWMLKEDAENNSDRRTVNAVLKNIADVQKARLDALQKAGINFDSETEKEMLKLKQQSERLQKFLAEFASKHPEIMTELLEGMSEVWDEKATVVIVQ